MAIDRLGPVPVRRLHRRLGLLGPEGRAGDGGGDPDLDPGDRPGAALPAAVDAARERDPHRHRRRVRRVVAGAIFTLPALYILDLDPHPVQTIFICLAGGCLGVLFLIPLRRYFVREMHGELPYPEATAITEVLVTGERGGSQARLLLAGDGASPGVYDFFVTTFQVWREFVDLQFVPAVRALAEHGPHRRRLRRRRVHPRARLRDGPARVDDARAPAACCRISCWCR